MTSRTRSRVRMRCGITKCRTRFTLRKAPHMYKRPVKCPACGDTIKVRNVEAERRRELAARERRQGVCRCGNYPFPHTRGSLRFCVGHPRFEADATFEEEQDYIGCMRTPRGACV